MSLTITRIYDASREAVWRAWTEPAQIAAWWGKRGWRTPVSSVTLDLRPGGAFRLASINEADGREMRHDAVYREIVPPERLVFARGEEVATVTLTDLGDGRTEMTFHTTMEASAALREASEFLDDYRAFWAESFDRLGEHLEDR